MSEESSGKKQPPLSPRTLNMIFNSNDMTSIMQSRDSLADMAKMFGSSDSTTQEQIAKIFASSDSNVFKSVDFLKSLDAWKETSSNGDGATEQEASGDAPQQQQQQQQQQRKHDPAFFAEFLKSLDAYSTRQAEGEKRAAAAAKTALKDMYTSKDWVPGYASGHVDINYDKSLFTTGESPGSDNNQAVLPNLSPWASASAPFASSSMPTRSHDNTNNKWMQMYADGLKTTAAKVTPAPAPQASAAGSSWNNMYTSILSNPLQPPSSGSGSINTPAAGAGTSLPPMPPLTGNTASNHATQQQQEAARPLVSEPKQPPHKKSSGGAKKKRVYKSRKVIPDKKVYVDFTDEDVLLGRGGLANKHPGNKRYREHIEYNKEGYRSASKDEKTEWAELLVKTVHGYGGRFLEKDSANGLWYIVPDIVARRKAGQALREDNTAESRAAKREKYKKNRNKR